MKRTEDRKIISTMERHLGRPLYPTEAVEYSKAKHKIRLVSDMKPSNDHVVHMLRWCQEFIDLYADERLTINRCDLIH